MAADRGPGRDRRFDLREHVRIRSSLDQVAGCVAAMQRNVGETFYAVQLESAQRELQELLRLVVGLQALRRDAP